MDHHPLGALAPLADYPQFIVALLVPLPTGKTDKLPCDYRTGSPVDAHDPRHWTTYENAARAVAAWGPAYRIGFVLTAKDPFVCVDLDNCREGDGWSAFARGVCASLTGAVVEVSQSGKGLHAWLKTSKPLAHVVKRAGQPAECYSEKRFIVLGSGAVGTMTDDCPGIHGFVARYFPPRVSGAVDVPDDGPRSDWRGPADNSELIRRAVASRSQANVFGAPRASFADLWTADAAALARAFPSASDAYDRSSADAALVQHLCFWTGCDADRVERLMRQSALVREKWDREDYMHGTITKAIAQQRDVLADKPSAVEQSHVGEALTGSAPRMVAVEGSTFLSPAEQAKLFEGCVYVVDAHKVLIPGGSMLKPDQFKAKFGGYSFAMDTRNEKVSRNAFEAFTESQALRGPKADETCFKPRRPYGEIVMGAGRSRVNTWWHIDIPRKRGDAAPFLTHLSKLLPVGRDAETTLAYLAACVQHQGYKFPWAIVLQGVEGNGKTILSECTAFAVGRRYVHWPKASKLSNQFNSWMLAKVLYCVEDIFTSERVDVIEELKPMITGGAGLEIEGKGADQFSAEICGNFIFNTNHPTGLKKTGNDRRFCWLATAQQAFADLARDGLTNEYFLRFRQWLNEQDGFAIVAELLWTHPIPDDLNPAVGCPRAPRTSSTDAAIAQSLGRAEQEVLAAAERGDPGFADGWASTIMLDRLLERRHRDREVAPRARSAMLEALGYVLHPALAPTGQVHHVVHPDAAKPKLYVKAGHHALTIGKAADVARAYSAAQAPQA
jgi:Family of unknown function (DUF5906)